MNRFFISNEPKYRLARTIVQGIIGVIIANLDSIIAHVDIIPMWARAIVVALVMAVLSPIMAMMGTTEMPEKGELPYNFWETLEEEGEEDGEDSK